MRGKTATSRQRKVITALLGGRSISDAAATGGVSRETIYRWLREDFVFLAELNAARQELARVVAQRLESLTTKALDCVEKAVAEGDVKAAMEILKGGGVLNRCFQGIGSSNPAELAAEAADEAELADISEVLRGFHGDGPQERTEGR